MSLAAAWSVFLALAACSGPETGFKNAVFFIGDGMSVECQVAASRYLYGTDTGLAWHYFPGRAYVATWDVTAYNRRARIEGKPSYKSGTFTPRLGYDVMKEGIKPLGITIPGPSLSLGLPATDSASSGTAYSTGFKTDSGNVAWLPGDPPDGRLRTILEDFRDRKGGAIGVVSSVPFNHATPAVFVAHNTSRNNYYTGYRGYEGPGLAEEIILQIKPDVVIGGGHPIINNPGLESRKGYISEDLLSGLRCSEEYVFVERTPGADGGRALIEAADRAAETGRKLFGLFGGQGGNFDPPEAEDSPGHPLVRKISNEDPSLAEATLAALRVAARDEDGFFLMIEQGDIDWTNHDNDFVRMIATMYDLEEAVKAALTFIDRPGDGIDRSNTVFIVTADHATGGLRLNPDMPMEKGDLPLQIPYDPDKLPPPGSDRMVNAEAAAAKKVFRSPYLYPDGEVEYHTLGHTNDLVTLSATCPACRFFLEFKGLWYPGPILDNTHVYRAIRKALDF